MPVVPSQYFLLRLQFMGFRYHGWQHQPGQQTVEGMLRKTFRFVLPGHQAKFLAAGRTDARVSAWDFPVQLILKGPLLEDIAGLEANIARNLPPDIRLLGVQPVPQTFNAIRDCREKTYRYLFTTGHKPHPYTTAWVGFLPGLTDVPAMMAAAPIFEGKHHFNALITSAGPRSKTYREVISCRISQNTWLTASIMPDPCYVMEVRAPGFGRNQVRLMVAALAAIGRGELDAQTLTCVLKGESDWKPQHIAPASGLHLWRTEFDGPHKNTTL
ncbi:tRNA pseudouridine(38-40) synthase TruA [Robiginitalea sp. M366]|uniref:tRNA pseudouridine(38-40) synthase TruA n=1 Tax=Robiginitalea aestuariiviva TaxID=3036903 RepID=UPI00240E2289|nr:tRNA pseudouridine(38-40) synthase TruA [Robiginitalea aestuariiviva]MDG1572954.1 tRNA pseudouridine(38-40) synthase TruA [Robiginitalea aestuariiviva]